MGRASRASAAKRTTVKQKSRHTPPGGLERRAAQIEAFELAGVHAQPITPEEHPEVDVAQVQLLLQGNPAYLLRGGVKTYTTFMSWEVAKQLGDGLVSIAAALAQRPVEQTASGITLADAGTNLAALAAQASAADDLRA